MLYYKKNNIVYQKASSEGINVDLTTALCATHKNAYFYLIVVTDDMPKTKAYISDCIIVTCGLDDKLLNIVTTNLKEW